jgi:hypothetical protein
MQHTIEEMYTKVCAMRDMAQIAHNMKYARPSEDHFEEITHLVDQIQAMAGDIFHDRTMHPKVKEKQMAKDWNEFEDQQQAWLQWVQRSQRSPF